MARWVICKPRACSICLINDACSISADLTFFLRRVRACEKGVYGECFTQSCIMRTNNTMQDVQFCSHPPVFGALAIKPLHTSSQRRASCIYVLYLMIRCAFKPHKSMDLQRHTFRPTHTHTHDSYKIRTNRQATCANANAPTRYPGSSAIARR